MASAGQRYVETVDTLTNAAAADYQAGQLLVALDTGLVYVHFGDAWVLVGGQV